MYPRSECAGGRETSTGTPRTRNISDSVLLIFIDGLGIGTRGKYNPIEESGSDLFAIFDGENSELPFNGRFAVTDATLGIQGIPQSATGQTTILTGINAPAILGRHLHGYPSVKLKTILAEHSIYLRLKSKGLAVTFANAYTPAFFIKKPRFVSVTTTAAESAGLKLRTIEDLREGRAVYQDFSNCLLIGMGVMVPSITPEEAGRRLAGIAAGHNFTLYEYFLSDRAGHLQNHEFAVSVVKNLTRFLRSVLENTDLEGRTVIVTSDHGNIEDLRTRTHTANPVPTMAFGFGADEVTSAVKDLTGITPVISDLICA